MRGNTKTVALWFPGYPIRALPMRKILPVLLFVSSFTLAAQTPHLVKDINTTQGSPAVGSSAFGFAPFGNLILFNAITEATGEEPYVTDGNSGATLLANPPGGWSRPTGFTGANT